MVGCNKLCYNSAAVPYLRLNSFDLGHPLKRPLCNAELPYTELCGEYLPASEGMAIQLNAAGLIMLADSGRSLNAGYRLKQHAPDEAEAVSEHKLKLFGPQP